MSGTVKVGIVAVLLTVIVFALTIHDFLAINHPVHANVLVVEGWIWESSAMKDAAAEFKSGPYTTVVTVGTLPSWHESGQSDETAASRAAEQLKHLGVSEQAIHILTVRNIDNHRTYTSALAVKQWLLNSHLPVTGINVFTIGAHARKSLVLFKRAFGDNTPIGVIAGIENGYDPERWWLSVNGIYTVLRKTIGYLYAEWWPLPDDPHASPDHDQVTLLGRNAYGSC
ncbi:MAG TPA: cytosine deaminase [Nitrospira sp.]|nr:cytosine deaminase [Nitrospira sp.]